MLKLIIFLLFIYLIKIFLYNFQYNKEFLSTIKYKSCDNDVIDIVYTWVNGSDPLFLKELHYYQYLDQINKTNIQNNTTFSSSENIDDDNIYADRVAKNRFRDNEELRYSLRSIWKYAPWVNKIHILTNGQIPYWLNTNHPKINIVTHEDVFVNKSHLPTFSSPAIEAHIHRIPNLAENFIYFNDDVMLGNYIYPDDFYTKSNGHKIYFAWDIPSCSEGCTDTWIGDGYCDQACNNKDCNFDAGDCINTPPNQLSNNNNDHDHSNQVTATYCTHMCPDTWLGDKICDKTCNNIQCAYDGGDCIINNNTLYNLYLDDVINNNITEIYNRTLYIDLQSTFNEIMDAKYNNNNLIRSAIITEKKQIMTIIFYPYHIIVDKLKDNEKILEQESYMDVIFNITGILNISNTTESIQFKLRHIFDNNEIVSIPIKDNKLKKEEELLIQDVYDPYNPDISIEEIDLIHNRRHLLNNIHDKDKIKQIMTNYDQIFHNITSTYSKNFIYKHPILIEQYIQSILNYDDINLSIHQRKLLDYGSSLRYTHQLYVDLFGSYNKKAKAIAHMPHFINKSIMKQVQDELRNEYKITSSHKFRAKNDIQMAFAYFYYIIHKKQVYNAKQYWIDHIDHNHNNQLDFYESIYLSVYLNNGIRINLNETYFKNITQVIDYDTFLNSTTLQHDLLHKISNEQQYKYEEVSLDQVDFYMISTNNHTIVQKRLDEIIANKHKFICLNDDMNHTHDIQQELHHVIQSFYQTLYPIPSPYEINQSHSTDIKKQVPLYHHHHYIIIFLSILISIILLKFYK